LPSTSQAIRFVPACALIQDVCVAWLLVCSCMAAFTVIGTGTGADAARVYGDMMAARIKQLAALVTPTGGPTLQSVALGALLGPQGPWVANPAFVLEVQRQAAPGQAVASIVEFLRYIRHHWQAGEIVTQQKTAPAIPVAPTDNTLAVTRRYVPLTIECFSACLRIVSTG
jgi:hypothetical protein